MEKLKIFDLHCDTLTGIFRSGLTDLSSLMLRPEDCGHFDGFTQLFAVFASPALSDNDAFSEACEVLENAEKLLRPYTEQGARVLLSVEDGRILGGELARLDTLASLGVRALTLVWGGDCCVGGAWSSESGAGLTDFGKEVVRRCAALGILPDLSHASDRSFDDAADILEELGLPLLATHSDSRTVCPHGRNLTDGRFERIVRSGGLCGISLCPEHVSVNGKDDRDAADSGCGIPDVADHILHYLSLGGEKTVALGCDCDGIEKAPRGLEHPSGLDALADELLRRGVCEDTVRDVFFRNAERFFA